MTAPRFLRGVEEEAYYGHINRQNNSTHPFGGDHPLIFCVFVAHVTFFYRPLRGVFQPEAPDQRPRLGSFLFRSPLDAVHISFRFLPTYSDNLDLRDYLGLP